MTNKIPTGETSSTPSVSPTEDFDDFDFLGDFDTEIDVNFDNFNKSTNENRISDISPNEHEASNKSSNQAAASIKSSNPDEINNKLLNTDSVRKVFMVLLFCYNHVVLGLKVLLKGFFFRCLLLWLIGVYFHNILSHDFLHLLHILFSLLEVISLTF